MTELAASARGVVVQFAKAPVAGEVKTRLTPHVSPARAATLHEALCAHVAARCVNPSVWDYQLWVTQLTHPCWHHPRFAGVALKEQMRGDLGDRMQAAIAGALVQGAAWVSVIGSDCPDLSQQHLLQATAALAAGADLVLNPALDGGYVQIAMARPLPVFSGINWGSDQVLEQTLALARKHRINVHLAPALADIDRPEDLPRLASWPELAQMVR